MSLNQEPVRGRTADEKISEPPGSGAVQDTAPDISIDPARCPALLNASRLVLSTLSEIRAIAEMVKKDLAGNPAEQARSGWSGHPALALELQDLRESIAPKLKLEKLLVKELAQTDNHADSMALLAMCGSLDAHDELREDYILPAMELVPELPNGAYHRDLSTRILKSLPLAVQEEFIQAINFDRLSTEEDRMKSLAHCLVQAMPPDALMDNLVGLSRAKSEPEDVYSNHDGAYADSEASNADYDRRLRIQTLACRVLIDLEESGPQHLKDALVPHMEVLYQEAINNNIGRTVTKLLKAHNWGAALRIIDGAVKEDAGEDNEARSHRFFAVGHLSATLTPQYLLTRFGEILRDERDPFVCGNALYIMLHEAKEPGRNTVADVITEQIRRGDTSYALAGLSSLAGLHLSFEEKRADGTVFTRKDDYADVVGRIFSSAIPEGFVCNAFKLLIPEDLSIAKKLASGSPVFQRSLEKKPDISTDLVDGLGLKRLLGWASDDRHPMLQKNSRELLEISSRTGPFRMSHMIANELIEAGDDHSQTVVEALAGLKLI